MVGGVPYLGAGYDTFDGSVKSSILNITADNGGASEITSDYSVCTTTDEIMQKLNVDASVSVTAGTTSIAGKLEFAQSLTRSSTSVVALLVITKVSQQSTVQSVEFKDTFSDAAQMFKRGGDSFISYIKLGAQYYGAYSCSAENVEKQQSIKSELTAEMSKVNFNLKLAVENVSKHNKIQLSFYQKALGLAENELPSQDELASYTSKFNSMTSGKLEVLEFGTRLYEEVKDCPDMSQIVYYHGLYTVDQQGNNAYSIVEMQAQQTKAAIQSLAQAYEFYHQKWREPEFDERQRKVQDLFNKIRAWKWAVHSKPTSKIPELDLDLSCLEVPVPRIDFRTQGYAGDSSGGIGWEDVDASMVLQCVRPLSIAVRAAVVIDKLTTVYTFKDGKRADIMRAHGGDGATDLQNVTLDSHQRVDGVNTEDFEWDGKEGDNKWVVKWFEIKLEGSERRMEFGNKGDKNFHPQYKPDDMGDQWAFVGWRGRSGRVLDFLQAMYVVFDKPDWVMPTLRDSGS